MVICLYVTFLNVWYLVEIPPGYDEAVTIQETPASSQPASSVADAAYVDFFVPYYQ